MAYTSWAIVRIATGEVIAETFLRHVADAINRERYSVVPIGEYLASLNRRPLTCNPRDARPDG